MKLNHFISDAAAALLRSESRPVIRTCRIGWGTAVKVGASVGGMPLAVNGRNFACGWGDHGQSRLELRLPEPATAFSARVGIQDGMNFRNRAVFIVEDGAGRELARSPELASDDPAFHLEARLPGLATVVLRALDTGVPEDFTGTPQMANFNWCDPEVTLESGRKLRQDDFAAVSDSVAAAFDYDGRSPVFARRDAVKTEDSPDRTVWQIDANTDDGLLTLRETLTVYKDFPVIEWLPELLNAGDRPSGIVSNFRSLALNLELEDRSTGYLPNPYPVNARYPLRDVALRRTVGSKNSQNDFTAETVWLRPRYPESVLRLDTDEGRSSSSWLPFFGLDVTDMTGLNVGIGWSGAWYAEFRHLDELLTVDAGMPETHFRVLPGEKLRQVSIFIHHRDGMNVEDGQNQLRRFLLKYHSPHRADGSLVRTPWPMSSWGGLPSEEMFKVIDFKKQYDMPFDTYWVDAGWFGRDRYVTPTEYDASDWASTVGYWRVNQVPHPGGLRPVTDAARAAGMKFLLWVEMERVMPDTPVAKEHPEWMLTTSADAGNLLLNLGDEAACNWAIGEVDRLVREEGIDHYRQDFNFNTIPFWRDNDAPDRVGVTEMKFIAGLYRFWDTLRQRFPDMLIDNCASGGRRIDFETNSRSICLYRSDMLGRPWYDCSEANHIEVPYLSMWVPLHSGGTTLVDGDDYGFLSGVATGVDGTMTDLKMERDYRWYREVMTAAVRLGGYFYYDFYLLTPDPESRKGLYAYQCDAPELGSGCLAVFRRPEGDEAERTLKLRRIDPEAQYEVERFRGDTRTVSGAELADFRAVMPEPRSVALYFYRRK